MPIWQRPLANQLGGFDFNFRCLKRFFGKVRQRLRSAFSLKLRFSKLRLLVTWLKCLFLWWNTPNLPTALGLKTLPTHFLKIPASFKKWVCGVAIALLWCLYWLLWTDFKRCSGFFIVEFEQVNPGFPANVYLFKGITRKRRHWKHKKKVRNMSKVDKETTSLTLFCCLYCPCFTPFSGVFIYRVFPVFIVQTYNYQ